jgi:hypothetical protein
MHKRISLQFKNCALAFKISGRRFGVFWWTVSVELYNAKKDFITVEKLCSYVKNLRASFWSALVN